MCGVDQCLSGSVELALDCVRVPVGVSKEYSTVYASRDLRAALLAPPYLRQAHTLEVFKVHKLHSNASLVLCCDTSGRLHESTLLHTSGRVYEPWQLQ